MPFYPNGAPIFVPSTSPTSVGVGITSLSDDTTGGGNTAIGNTAGSLITTGANNTILGSGVASTTLATGSNNIIIGTSATQDAATASTSNTMLIGAGSTAIISATGTNSTPAVTVPGTLTVTGALTASGGLSGGTITNTLTGIGATVGGVASGSFTSGASNTTLANVVGMVATVVSGATYIVDMYISCSAAATPGIKLSLNGGTATATAFVADTWVYNGTTLSGETNVSAITSNLFSSAVAATAIAMSGTLVVNAGGTIQLQAAQSVSNGTATTIANYSYIQLTRIA